MSLDRAEAGALAKTPRDLVALLVREVDRLDAVQPVVQHVASINSDALDALNDLLYQRATPGVKAVRATLERLYGSGSADGDSEGEYDRARIFGGPLGVRLACDVLDRLVVAVRDAAEEPRELRYILRSLTAAVRHRCEDYPSTTVADEPIENGAAAPRQRENSPNIDDEDAGREQPAPTTTRARAPSPPATPEPDDRKLSNARESGAPRKLVRDGAQPGQEEAPTDDARDSRRSKRRFHPYDPSTWNDPALRLAPPLDLPRSHDGLEIFDVPFSRQLKVHGMTRNEIGNMSQQAFDPNARNLCLQTWQPRPCRTGEPFVMYEKFGTAYLDALRTHGPLEGAISCFFRHGAHDWRYAGDYTEHARWTLDAKYFASLTDREDALWRAYLDAPALGTPKAAAFDARPTRSARSVLDAWKTKVPNGGLSFALFKAVGYDGDRITHRGPAARAAKNSSTAKTQSRFKFPTSGRIRHWLESHERTAGVKAAYFAKADAVAQRALAAPPAAARRPSRAPSSSADAVSEVETRETRSSHKRPRVSR
ncbi:hypothetical protein JCM11491_001306 [Sporobolomyces phaffii]